LPGQQAQAHIDRAGGRLKEVDCSWNTRPELIVEVNADLAAGGHFQALPGNDQHAVVQLPSALAGGTAASAPKADDAQCCPEHEESPACRSSKAQLGRRGRRFPARPLLTLPRWQAETVKNLKEATHASVQCTRHDLRPLRESRDPRGAGQDAAAKVEVDLAAKQVRVQRSWRRADSRGDSGRRLSGRGLKTLQGAPAY
jgi:hypothetical protein